MRSPWSFSIQSRNRQQLLAQQVARALIDRSTDPRWSVISSSPEHLSRKVDRTGSWTSARPLGSRTAGMRRHHPKNEPRLRQRRTSAIPVNPRRPPLPTSTPPPARRLGFIWTVGGDPSLLIIHSFCHSTRPCAGPRQQAWPAVGERSLPHGVGARPVWPHPWGEI